MKPFVKKIGILSVVFSYCDRRLFYVESEEHRKKRCDGIYLYG